MMCRRFALTGCHMDLINNHKRAIGSCWRGSSGHSWYCVTEDLALMIRDMPRDMREFVRTMLGSDIHHIR